MRSLTNLSLFLFLTSTVAADDRGLRFTTVPNALPAMKSIIVVKAGEPAPGKPKHQSVAQTAKYDESIQLANNGPFDVYWQGKSGIAIRAAAGIKLKMGEIKEIKLGEHLGVVNFRGDDQPRASLLTIAPQDDPGPDEKGHQAIQTAKDYREDMVVPQGFYSLWITPDNGGRPRKVIDRFRVQAGKSVRLD